ncbi:MAG: radical SAM protein [Desulfurococcales archaeon]|nr:radical SAM protein [Desulfurococcales archaeon]
MAYSSLFYRQARNRLVEEGVYAGSWFLEEGMVRGDTRGAPGKARLLLVSLPFEIMYRDYAELMILAGLNPYRSASGDDAIVLAGGPAVTANPSPVLELVDAVMIGEVDDIVMDIVEAAAGPGSKEHRLERLAEIPGVLVPGVSETPVRRHYVKDIDKHIISLDQRTPRDAEPVWGHTYIVEASRGCGRGCRFCMEGFIFRPKRDRSLETMKSLIDEAPRQGFERLSFYSLSFFDNPASDKALEYAVSRGLQASVPSLRADSINGERLRLIGMAGQRTLTIAPETGSCRVCRAINKVIKRDIVEWIAEEAPSHGIRSLKLYLITGFPGEGEEDFEETLTMVERVASILRRRGLRLKVSLNPFMPKPVTPLQWAPLAPRELFRGRARSLKRLAGRAGNIDASIYDHRWAAVQTVLARGGPEISRLVVEWARTGQGTGHFRRAARIAGIDPEKYTGEIPADMDPVWHSYAEHPYAGLSLLRREYRLYRSLLSSRR